MQRRGVSPTCADDIRGTLILEKFLAHYNGIRPHRALRQLSPAQAATIPPAPIDLAAYRLCRKPILGGLTSEYQIAA